MDWLLEPFIELARIFHASVVDETGAGVCRLLITGSSPRVTVRPASLASAAVPGPEGMDLRDRDGRRYPGGQRPQAGERCGQHRRPPRRPRPSGIEAHELSFARGQADPLPRA
jgi:hypothetical protein